MTGQNIAGGGGGVFERGAGDQSSPSLKVTAITSSLLWKLGGTKTGRSAEMYLTNRSNGV